MTNTATFAGITHSGSPPNSATPCAPIVTLCAESRPGAPSQADSYRRDLAYYLSR